MGACYDCATVNTTDPSEAVRQMGHVISDSQYENGHGGYSGTLAEAQGAVISGLEFTSYADAEEYVEEHARKWGPALGVLVTPESGEPFYYFGACCSS